VSHANQDYEGRLLLCDLTSAATHAQQAGAYKAAVHTADQPHSSHLHADRAAGTVGEAVALGQAAHQVPAAPGEQDGRSSPQPELFWHVKSSDAAVHCKRLRSNI
jgi:hypothetical protein